MFDEDQLSIKVVKGGFILTSFNVSGATTEVFTSASKLLKTVKQLLEIYEKANEKTADAAEVK